MSDAATKHPGNVVPKRRASDRQQPEQLAKAATDGNLIQRRRTSDWPATTKRTVLDGGCIVLAFPGCTVPVVNKPRRGRLPASIPSLSRARAERQQRAEEAQQRAKRLADLEGTFRAVEMMIKVLRYDLRGFEATESVSRKGAA